MTYYCIHEIFIYSISLLCVWIISFGVALNIHALYNSGSPSYEAKEVFLAALVSEGLFCTTFNLSVIVESCI